MNSFDSLFIQNLQKFQNSVKVAFHINGVSYTYKQLIETAASLQQMIKKLPDDLFGLYATDDIRTYASILALWFSGKAYVPFNPGQPKERHKEVASVTDIRCILSSEDSYTLGDIKILKTSDINPFDNSGISLETITVADDKLAYILFTSGSTGTPKGVQITRGNVAAFIDSMDNIGLNITSEDKCLQPFDLTFDFSVSGYVIPLVKGASIYTVPLKATKFTYIALLLEEHHLSVLQMVPSMIRNLLPYIAEVDVSSVRYNILCGEALTGKVIKKWHKGNQSMISYNMYGPTEDTVFCTCYILNHDNIDNPLSNNDIICIGKTFKNNEVVLLNDNNEIINDIGVVGELCLSGKQLTPGYFNNPLENDNKFFYLNGQRFYRSGDLCYYSQNEDLMYVSRKDFQLKINGFRVELEEIENKYFKISEGRYSVVIPYENKQGNTELAIIIEGKEYDVEEHHKKLASVLPFYEIPQKWLFVKSIPLNQNGKIDRPTLRKMFNL